MSKRFRQEYDQSDRMEPRHYNVPLGELIPFENLPDKDALFDILANRRFGIFGAVQPRLIDQIDLPDIAPATPEFDYNRSGRDVRLRNRDIVEVDRPRTLQCREIIKALVVGRNRALFRDSSLGLIERSIVVHYDPSAPEEWRDRADDPVVWMNETSPVMVVKRTLSATRPTMGTFEKPGGQLVLIAKDHANGCACPSTDRQNNMFFNAFSLICVPASMQAEYPESFAIDPRDANEKYAYAVNPSVTWFGKVSRACTWTGVLTTRQSLACIKRKEAVLYKPPFANVDLLDHLALLAGVNAQLHRAEFRQFIKHFEKENGTRDAQGYCRFPAAKEQLKSIDVRCRSDGTNMTCDSILSNTVHCAPFHGAYLCGYCGEDVKATGISSLITHLAKHQALRNSNFTCPTCITVAIVDWENFVAHFEKIHHPSSALMVVCDETCISARLCWGLALTALISTLQSFAVKPDQDRINAESPKFYHDLGTGYKRLSDTSKAELRDELAFRTRELLPEDARMESDARAARRLEEKLRREEEERQESLRRTRDSYTEPKWSTVAQAGARRAQRQIKRIGGSSEERSTAKAPQPQPRQPSPTDGTIPGLANLSMKTTAPGFPPLPKSSWADEVEEMARQDPPLPQRPPRRADSEPRAGPSSPARSSAKKAPPIFSIEDEFDTEDTNPPDESLLDEDDNDDVKVEDKTSDKESDDEDDTAMQD